jgi:hypothetical protein
MRFYLKFGALPTGEGHHLYMASLDSTVPSSTATSVFIIYSGGNYYWGLYNNAGETQDSTASNPTTGVYYCVELLRDKTNNIQKLWINGVLKATRNDTIANNTTNAAVGIDYIDSSVTQTIYVDDVVVADSYIGPLQSASKLSYTAGSGQSLSPGSVSSVITVQVQDSNGNPVTTGATASLSTSSTGGHFYSDSGGNTQIASIVISSGQSSGNFYYKDTSAGYPTLTASSTGLTSATTQFTISSSEQLTATAPLQLSDNNLSIPKADGSTDGYLDSSHWTTFNNKQNALSQANGSTNGYLSSSDWNTFNNKQNTLQQATGSTNGYLASSDWTTFHNKQNALTTGNLTSSQITISGGPGAVIGAGVTLTLPQNIDQGATPTLNGLTSNGPILMPDSFSQMSAADILYYLFGFDNKGLWQPVNRSFQNDGKLGTNYIRFTDSTTLTANLFAIRSTDNYNEPLIAVDRGIIVKKDVSAGGFLASNQGALSLGYGLTSMIDPPKIWLSFSDTPIIPDDIDQGTSYPSNPVKGQLLYLTTDNTLCQWYDNSGDSPLILGGLWVILVNFPATLTLCIS